MPVPTSSFVFETAPAMVSETASKAPSTSNLSSPGPSRPPAKDSTTVASVVDTARTSEEGDSDQHGQRSSRSTPSRTSVDLTRSQTAGKGGCWTCRVRRKKCDEEREGDSCKTCLRLRIKCLGWGPKRPEWMRDKDKVAEYKAGIKEQLTRAGLIRGQPRTAYQLPSKNIVPSQSGLFAGVASTGSPSLRRSFSDIDMTYRPAFASSSGMHASAVVPVLPNNANSQDPASMNPYIDISLNDSMFFTSPTLPIMSNADSLSYDVLGNDLASMAPSLTAAAPPLPPPMPDSTVSHEEYIVYYFNHVRPLQFVFAGNSITSLLYSILYAEPRGVLANALCALASLHSARLRISQGLENPNNIPQRSIPKFFYDQAVYQLMNKKAIDGQYLEQDAIVAAYLVSFSVLSGGSTNWTSMLDIACDWLSQTGIHEDQNPKLTLMNMSNAGRFAAKATMWMDILSSVTFLQPPRFLPLYRRLFKSCAGYWASAGEHFECRMDFLTGCPDGAILAIAETAALAHWKATEMRNGCLSVRELIRRGDMIEQEMIGHPIAGLFEGEKPSVQGTDPVLSVAGTLSSLQRDGPDATAPSDEIRLLVAKIHRENALLYLHTVLSESRPGVPEISGCTSVISDLLQRLPVTDYDRSIMFPLCLAGTLTDDPVLRDHITHRCAAHNDEYVGNLYQARTLMGAVWNRRQQAANMNQRGVPVEWRECLRDRWSNLLLV